MIHSARTSRQPRREVWSRDQLLRERAIALGQAIDTLNSYSSALNSFLNFVCLHDFPVEPTPDTLSFFAVYMSHQIEPKSVLNYLSGICQQLEPYFPNVCTSRLSPLVEQTMKGCRCLQSSPVKRKRALTFNDLHKVVNELATSNLHNDLLFIAMLLTGFFALMHLANSLSLMRSTSATGRRSQGDQRLLSPMNNTNSYFPLTRWTVSLTGTVSSSKKTSTATLTH